MKSNKKKIVFLLGVCIIFFSMISFFPLHNYIGDKNNSRDFERKKAPLTSTVYYEPYIHVWNNWSATAVTYPWCSGDGSWSNPYTIENVIINATNAPTFDPFDDIFAPGIIIGPALYDYFVIKNCTVFTSDPNNDVYGIWLLAANNGTLIDNDFSNCLDGIHLTISDNSTISENTVNNNYHSGINITSSKDTTITGNTINDNNFYGINLMMCNNTVISENSLEQNYKDTETVDSGAIHLEYCIDTTISSNLIKDNFGTGITNNICNNTIISDNTLERNKRGIFVQRFGIQIPLDYNYDIKIIGNTIENNQFGLWMDYTDGGEIKDNSIKYSNSTGVYIYQSRDLIILNNSISSNGQESNAHGLSIVLSADSEISMNTVSNNTDDGISLDYCSFLNVSNNIVDLNDEGIRLIDNTVWNNITDNTVRDNNGTGIELEDSNYNRVTGNVLSGNGECIKQEGTSEGNTIENNDCGEDGGGGQQLIPGFNLYLMLGLIGIISVILMMRRFKD